MASRINVHTVHCQPVGANRVCTAHIKERMVVLLPVCTHRTFEIAEWLIVHRYAITAWFYRSDASVQQQPHMQHTLRAPLLLAGGANAQMTSSEQDQHSLPGQQQRATHQRPPVPEQLGGCSPACVLHDTVVGMQQHQPSPELHANVCEHEPQEKVTQCQPVAQPACHQQMPRGLHQCSQPASSAASVGAAAVAGAAVFVSVVAYRDPECRWTLRELFLKASNPSRVFVGVVWQVDAEQDADIISMAGGDRTKQFARQVREDGGCDTAADKPVDGHLKWCMDQHSRHLTRMC